MVSCLTFAFFTRTEANARKAYGKYKESAREGWDTRGEGAPPLARYWLFPLSLRFPCAFLALSSTCVSISQVAWLTLTGTTCFSQEILRNVYKFERLMSEFCAWKYQNQTKRTSYFSKISYASARLRSGLKAPGETSKADVQSFIQLVQSPILIIHEPRLHSKAHMAWRDTTFSADKNSKKQLNWSSFMIFQLMVVLKNDC